MQPRNLEFPLTSPETSRYGSSRLARDADELQGGYNLLQIYIPWLEVVTELSDSMEEPAQFAKLIRRASGSQSANRGRDIGLFDAKCSPSYVNVILTKRTRELVIFKRYNNSGTPPPLL